RPSYTAHPTLHSSRTRSSSRSSSHAAAPTATYTLSLHDALPISFPCSNEGVLRPLLGLPRIRRKAQAQRIHATDVCAVQCLERRPIALLRAVDQIGRVHAARMPAGADWLGP